VKLICAYDRAKKATANHCCDVCGKLLCSFCGYFKDGIDYCNECWEKREHDIKTLKEKQDYSR